MSLLQMSFSGAILILVIAMLRAAMLNKLPKITFVVLWIIASVRLIVPFSISSTFSFYSLFTQKNSVSTFIAESPITKLLPITNAEQTAGITGAIDAVINGAEFSVLNVIYIVGCIVSTVMFVGAYHTCYRKVKNAKPINDKFISRWLQQNKTRRNVCIRECNDIFSPLTYGIIKPVILFPQAFDRNDHKQLSYVLLHEHIHIRRFDCLSKLFMTFVVCVHWFNPTVWLMYFLLNRDLELACDEAVLRSRGLSFKKDYALTLISLEEERSCAMQLCSGFSKNVSEERIVAIMKTKHISLFTAISAMILVCLLCMGFATTAHSDEISSDLQAPVVSSSDYQADDARTENSLVPENENVVSIVAPASKWVWPTKSNEISLKFGVLSRPGVQDIFIDHINIRCEPNDDIYAAVSGTVIETGFDAEYGNYIVIAGTDNTKTIYGHLSTVLVSKESFVSAGERIGCAGKTGTATGYCLSFAVLVNDEAVDPMAYYE